MNQILFSVIIPLYNKEKYIEQTVHSVLGQTVSDFELIVVDDGSTDQGPQRVKKIQDPRIRLISQQNAGVSAARNRGIREAEGEYICFLDADDTWYPVFLETVERLFRGFPEAGVVCPSYEVSYGNRTVHPQWKSVDPEEDGYVRDFYEMATAPFWVMNSSCVAIRREVILGMDPWFQEYETVYEDLDFWTRLGTASRVAHSKTVCATYQRETDNNARKTHTQKIVYSKSFMNTLDRLAESDDTDDRQKEWIREMKDRRMVPYIFSLLLVQDKAKAGKELSAWAPCERYRKYKYGLKVCSLLPAGILKRIQHTRVKVF